MNYYNEWDPFAAAWLRELIKYKHIPDGYVDERSITEVTCSDLEGFTQCHFFAGIGGWSRALYLAGIPETVPLWSGSPPCQPFSVAGAGAGRNDPRHLAPAFLDLVAECRPQYVFGEQVAASVTKDQWADALLIELAEEGYASGFAVLPACSVGAPHKRDRLFFGASKLAFSLCAERDGKWLYRLAESDKAQREWTATEFAGRCSADSLADANDPRSQGWPGVPERTDKQLIGARGVADRVANAEISGWRKECTDVEWCNGRNNPQWLPAGCGTSSSDNATATRNIFWSDADWLFCRDQKFRPVEPGAFPLANGVPARVGRLRGYGNAIVPQVAAEFIRAFFESAPCEFD